MSEYKCTREGDISAIQTEIVSVWKRIDEMRSIYKSIQQLSINTSVLVEQMKETRVDVLKLREDVEDIKREPSDNYKHYIRYIVGILIGAIVMKFIGGV